MKQFTLARLALHLAWAFGATSEGRSSRSSTASAAELHSETLLAASSREALGKVMRRTTLASALRTLSNHTEAPKELKSFLELSFRSSSTAQHRASQGFLLAQRSGSQQGRKGLGQAKEMLTQMVTEATRKLDLEQMKCADYDRAQKQLIAGTRGDIATFNAQAASAREAILLAEEQLSLVQTKIPKLDSELKTHEGKCTADVDGATAQLRIVEADLNVMGSILKKTQCEATAMMFLQCRHAFTGESFITFRRKVLRVKTAQFSNATRRALQRSLSEAASVAPGETALLQTGERTDEGTDSSSDSEDDAASDSEAHDHDSPLVVGNSPDTKTSDAPTSRSKQRSKCSLSNETSCDLLRERFLLIDSGIREKAEELKHQISTIQGQCEKTSQAILAEISNFETQQMASQTALAGATKQQNEAEAASRLKNVQLGTLIKEHAKETHLCKKNIQNFQGEICAVRKIRGEVSMMAGGSIYSANIHIQDCEVSAWSNEACSLTCGGGTQTLARQVLAPPKNGGAPCPKLTSTQACNTQDCPVNCQVDEWSGWSTCSAECGGGVRERARSIAQEAKFGGEPCGETTETESCGIASCDRECVLAEWSQWSACSKACGGGLQRRHRSIEVPARGGGKCFKSDAPERLHMQGCNQNICEVADGQQTLRCDSKIDVVLLLDSSGSLKEFGWAATKAAAKMLVQAFTGSTGGVRLAVQLFSGPKSYSDAKKCANDPVSMDPESQCGIQWLTHFTDDLAAAATAVDGANWIKSYTLTSIALGLADSELMGGRQDANSIVIVITDGRPLSKLRTGQAAERLRKKCRLMFVPVTSYAPLADIRSWASQPSHENVVVIPDFAALQQPATISNLIADVCPKVH